MVRAEIEIKYNSQTTTISIVEEWNALTKKQLLFIAQYWQTWKVLALNNHSLIVAKMQLLLRLLPGTKKEIKKSLQVFEKLQGEDLYNIAQLANFVFDKNTLTQCPLPIIKIGFRKFYAPGDRLGNINGFEFSFADANFMKYHNTGKEEHLNNLIGTLYRPGGGTFDKSGEKRVKFNHKMIESYVKYLKNLKYDEKQLILLWFMGCRQAIIDKNKAIFTSENTKKSENKGWISVIMALSGERFGNFEQTGNTDLSLIFMHLRELEQRNKKQVPK